MLEWGGDWGVVVGCGSGDAMSCMSIVGVHGVRVPSPVKVGHEFTGFGSFD